MKITKGNLINFFIITALLFIITCSKNFKNIPVYLTFPKNIAKIEGNHALVIGKDIFNLNKNILSDDCESWAVDLDLENLFINSYVNLSKKMFKEIKIIKGEFNESSFENNLYKTTLILEKNSAFLDFKTEGNKGVFTIILDSSFKIKGNKKRSKK